MRRLPYISFALLTIACQDVQQAPQLEASLLTPQAWSGGPVRLRVSAPPAAGTRIYIGNDTVAFSIDDDSTVTATAPQANGAFQVRLEGPGGAVHIEQALSIYGLRDIRLGPKMAGYLLPVSVAFPNATVFANGETSMVRIDLISLARQAYPATMHDPRCMRGPGPTPVDGQLVLARTGCVWAVWQMQPTPQKLIDSVPGGFRLVAQFSSNLWLVSPGQHLVCLRSLQPAINDCRQFEEINGFRFSRTGQRLFMYFGASTPNGVPLFSTATGDTVFSIHTSSGNLGASFTPDGDTLLVVAGSPAQLLMVRANGQRLDSLALPFETEDVLVDPTAPYVYVLAWEYHLVGNANTFIGHVLVVERPALRLVGDIVAGTGSSLPAADSICYACNDRLFLDPASRTLVLAGVREREGPALSPSSITRFDLIR